MARLSKLLLTLWLAAVPTHACELLVKAVDHTHSDPTEDARGSYKRGMIVVCMPDGHVWGNEERLPRFVVIKVPGISCGQVQKYASAWLDGNGDTVRRRLWQIRWADLPLAARQKLATTGELVIKAGTYNGAFDYTWTQVKAFFHNLQTDTDETADL